MHGAIGPEKANKKWGGHVHKDKVKRLLDKRHDTRARDTRPKDPRGADPRTRALKLPPAVMTGRVRSAAVNHSLHLIAQDLEAALSEERLLRLAEKHAEQYGSGSPFPHIVLDDFLPRRVIEALAFENNVCLSWPSHWGEPRVPNHWHSYCGFVYVSESYLLPKLNSIMVNGSIFSIF